MPIHIHGAHEHNLKDVDLTIGDGLTVVTGVSGSGKTSLVFDTIYHESRRRFEEIYSLDSSEGRLSPAAVLQIDGLGPAVAVGQNLLNRYPLSTLASASGLHPFLRLLYARLGKRVCAACGSPLEQLSQDEAVERLTAAALGRDCEVWASILQRTPGSHTTLISLLQEQFDPADLRMDGLPWSGQPLDPSHPHDISVRRLHFGQALPVQNARKLVQDVTALGCYFIEIRSRSATQILSLAPVCSQCGTWFGELQPVMFHQVCPYCQGKKCTRCSYTGLLPEAASVTWQEMRFPELLELTVQEAHDLFSSADMLSGAQRLRSEVIRRLSALLDTGLGYIALNRPSPTLSRGEAQRVRLAVALTSRLEDMLHILDEPTIGQHPADIQRLMPVFRKLGGPVIFVEHERLAAVSADQAVDLGPGAGTNGGRLVYDGTPAGLWEADTATGRFFSRRQTGLFPAARPAPEKFLALHGANLRNLKEIDISIPLGRLTVISGVSGSGKSTLVEDVLTASMKARKPVGCRGIEGPFLQSVMVDQGPIGRNPRSNPATYTKLSDTLRDLFASNGPLSASHFSFNRPEGACPTCHGMGAVEVTMRYLPSTWIPCADCEGDRYTDEVLNIRLPFNGSLLSIADVYRLTISEVLDLFRHEVRLPPAKFTSAIRMLEALETVGLGYLTLGQPSPTLSGGEAQRVKLSKFLGKANLSGHLLVLDEPSTGLHPQDLAGLVAVLDRLVRADATVVVVEHNTDLIRAADWIIDLGPGAGPLGGELLYAGPPAGILTCEPSLTGQALREEDSIRPQEVPAQVSRRPSQIQIRGARAHNLQNVSVDFPVGGFSVVTGVSGSGKSTLVMDVLETEARRRYLESLSMYERQGVKEDSEAEVDSVHGLGVTVTITPERRMFNRRATVGTATEISHHLHALLAAVGKRTCLYCGASMQRTIRQWECPQCGAEAAFARPRQFSSSTYGAACHKCHGVGSLPVPQPEKLIIHPELPLCSGAMYSPGFFPKGYLCKPYNGGYDMVQALARRYGFDPFSLPWQEMTREAQQAFLFGDPLPMSVIYENRKGQRYERIQSFPGFYGFVRDWDVGGTYTSTENCPQCGGTGLRPEYLAVDLMGLNVHKLHQLTLAQLDEVMKQLAASIPDMQPARYNLGIIQRRLGFLQEVGLGYIHLDRVAATLSAGEAQRIRLAGLLGSGLTSLTVLLDEPSRGLHPQEIQALIAALQSLQEEGSTVIVVEHEPAIIRAATHLVEIGPGAGTAGGRIIAQGPAADILNGNTLTARWLRDNGLFADLLERPKRKPSGWMVVTGARANNLCGEMVRIPLGVLAGVCGVSGSGKSTLIIDTLGRALAPRKQTTSVAYEPIQPGEHDAILNAPQRTLVIDQARAGVVSPVSYLGLEPLLRKVYAASPDARMLGLNESRLGKTCQVCGGRGVERMDMGFLPAVYTSCEVCQGTGYQAEAWQVKLDGLSLPELNSLTLEEIFNRFRDHPVLQEEKQILHILRCTLDVGLGYLVLNQPGRALSGGEAQRLKIAGELAHPSTRSTLYILDEPSVGQHLADVHRLTGVLHKLVEDGNSVLLVEHHPHMLAACDWLLEMGPGGGPDGGHIIASGTPAELAAGNTPTAPWLREVLEGCI